jgi:hypothetical protein
VVVCDVAGFWVMAESGGKGVRDECISCCCSTQMNASCKFDVKVTAAACDALRSLQLAS